MNGRTVFPTALVLGAALWLAGCNIIIPPRGQVRGPDMRLETLVPAAKFRTMDKVLLIGLDGVLTDDPEGGGLFSKPSPLIMLKDALQRAEHNDSIRAVLLRINSPGGSVTASDLIHAELMHFKRKTGKKIVVVCMGVAASGGYYAALAGDRIVAHPTSVIGSIGVVALFPRLSELGQKIGVDVRVIKSGDLKDMGSMWRDFQPQEREIFQNLINSFHERFLRITAAGRPLLSEDAIRRLADGRVYSAQEARELGLVDDIGYLEDAFRVAKSITGLPDASLVAYTYRYGYRGHYYASSAPHAVESFTPGAASSSSSARILFELDLSGYPAPFRSPFYYLWSP